MLKNVKKSDANPSQACFNVKNLYPLQRVWRFLEKTLGKWFVAPSSGVHFDVADGLRGVAILMVVVSHGFYSNPNGSNVFKLLQAMTGTGTLGVQIFFVLSGFLLSLPFFRARQKDAKFWHYPGFAARRALKIIPPFYLAIAFFTAWYFLATEDTRVFKTAFAWATGWAHFVKSEEINGSFWSLWVEIGFYALLPLLFFLVPGKSSRRTGWIIFAILTVTAVAARLIFWRGPGDPGDWFFITSRFPCSVDTFGWGVLFGAYYSSLGVAERPEPARKLAVWGYLGIFLLLCAALLLFWTDYFLAGQPKGRGEVELRHLLPGVAAFFMLFFLYDNRALFSRFLSTAVFRFLGFVSFEWFLLHQPIMVTFRVRMGGAHGSLFRYFFLIIFPAVVTLLVAAIVYHQYSLPIMKWGRRKLEAKPNMPHFAKKNLQER